ncbi:hypothetical protein ACLKA7_001473 [Drosophila subpalustris]
MGLKLTSCLTILTTFCVCATSAVLIGKPGHENYGPPSSPIQQYGPPKHHIPHREYGVPQQIPFQEYGPPALKYGPPKLNFLGGGGGSSGSSGLHEQIKTHFGVPKPFYGPPSHSTYRLPPTKYGPPPQPQQQYGPPPQPQQQYGPPPQPQQQYGPPPQQHTQYGPPPLKLQHRPAQRYGPPHPKPQFGDSSVTTQLLPAPLFNQNHQPATSYGPPASGPLNLPPKPVYEAPPNYGPPPLPINLPRPEQTIILSGNGGQRPSGGAVGHPVKQVQIQIDASGHTHSVSGSQVPFHTACDGWKPIPAPVGAYVEENRIETQDGYSNVHHGSIQGNSQSQNLVTQYSVGGATEGGSIIDGLSDEQLVAVALQGDVSNVITGPGGDAHLNSIDSDVLQLSIGSTDDSYSRPPTDSFAPGSVHDNKYRTLDSGSGASLPLSPVPVPQYGAPPAQFAALTSNNVQAHSQLNINIPHGSHGNPQPLPQHAAVQPNKPVAYRPPVPTGLLESIGATVHHLDQFGVKPPQQPSTYIPPATHEIALSGPPSPPQVVYGAPLNQQSSSQVIVQQQLPQQQSGPAFRPLQLYNSPGLPPQSHFQHAPLQPPTKQHYLPPPPIFFQQQHQHSENSYSASQYAQQYVHSQGLPLEQKSSRFNQQSIVASGPHSHQTVIVKDCGHGPNLVSSNGYQIQQQHQTFGTVSPASEGSYNLIAQSIPVAEQHTQFLSIPSDSYGSPTSENNLDFDHTGYASQKSAVTALPDESDPQNLPGLDGLNVISAQKSQSIELDSDVHKPTQNFELQFASSLNRAAGSGGNGAAINEQGANHEEILSQGLLQSILTAIEHPQSPRAQSRSDEERDNDKNEDPLTNEKEIRVELPSTSTANVNKEKIKEIEPIIAAEVREEDSN